MKGDGCDLISGLAESTRGVWSGDVDSNNGDLEQQYQTYQQRLHAVEGLQLPIPPAHEALYSQLGVHTNQLDKDLEFLHSSNAI